jgi:hypothetical protein
MVQRGYIILIAGGVMFAIGIALSALWGMQLAGIFLQDNTLVSAVSIEPGESIDATRQVTDTSRPVTIAIHIQGIEEGASTTLRNDIRLVETVTSSSGEVASRSEFSGHLFTTFTPEQTGSYVLTINNVGTEQVTIDGTFGYMPFVGMDDGQQVNLGQMSGLIGAATLTAIGFLTIIAGIVVVVIDSRKRKDSTVTTEGGVTYRKD